MLVRLAVEPALGQVALQQRLDAVQDLLLLQPTLRKPLCVLLP
jgi:hypothetical protein